MLKKLNKDDPFLGLFLVGAMLQGEAIKLVFDSPEVGGTIAKVLGYNVC
jgi:hypothetical protein